MKQPTDENGEPVKAGDKIGFSYGIPPVRVEADLLEIDGQLWAMTPGHNPSQCLVSELKECVEHFQKIDP